jgi:hypothetical protein
MSIEEEQVSVPDMEYHAKVTLPSADFQRICRDLATIGETSAFSSLSFLVFWFFFALFSFLEIRWAAMIPIVFAFFLHKKC